MIHPKHQQEWNESAVDSDLRDLNVISFMDDTGNYPVYSLLLPAESKRTNTGALPCGILKRYDAFIKSGGWWCWGGEDLLNPGELLEWGTFKPEEPRTITKENGKEHLMKYENPRGVPVKVITPLLPERLQDLILSQYGYNPEEGLTPWGFVLQNPEVPVVITEGAKKTLCVVSCGHMAIGVSGVSTAYSYNKRTNQRALKPHIKALATPGRKFIIMYDQDDKPATVKNVRKVTNRLAELLYNEGCETYKASWNKELGKGIDDVVAAHGKEQFKEILEQAVKIRPEKCENLDPVKQLELFTGKKVVRVNEQYLKFEDIGFEESRLVMIQSPKKTGKSTRIAEYVKECIKRGIKVIVPCHRELLGRSLARTWGLSYVDNLSQAQLANCAGMVLCVNSLHAKSKAFFLPEEWQGAVVIIDESEQVIKHLLTCSTCRKHRVAIIKSLSTLLALARRVIAADADLSDLSVDFLEELVNAKPRILVNDYKYEGQEWDIFSYNKPETVLAKLVESVEAREKAFVCVSGQKPNSLWGTQTVEKYLKERFPNLSILRIDSETTGQIGHPAHGVISRINEVAPRYDLVISSPSLCTGSSIEVFDHFSKVFGFGTGVVDPNTMRQFLARLRDSKAERHIYMAKTGHSYMAGGLLSIDKLLNSQQRVIRSQILALQKAGIPELMGGAVTIEAICPSAAALKAWAKIVTNHNFSMLNYRTNVLEGLKAEGHRIHESEDDLDGDKATLKKIKTENYEEYKKKVVDVTPLESEEEFKAIDTSNQKTETQRLQARNWVLKQSYGGDLTPEVVEIDDSGLYQKLRLLYYVTKGKKYIEGEDIDRAKAQIEEGGGQLWPSDFIKSQKGKVVQFLDFLNISPLLKEGLIFTNETPELVSIKKCFFDRVLTENCLQDLKQLGFTGLKESDTPIMIFKKILRLLGLKLVATGKRQGGGARHRFYTIQSMPLTEKIFKFWEQRSEERQSKRLERAARDAEKASVEVLQYEDRKPVPQIVTDTISCIRDAVGQDGITSKLRDVVTSETWKKWGDQILLGMDQSLQRIFLKEIPVHLF
ncbi:MAG: DUF3854 domain-containing protein [Moorea sp. SIO4A3]|nr:DUF3854 domain-containing protein [Moorena sp. SIO4A3]